ncbi:lytic transglycosylase domain-containing protein [Salmonella enterica]|nr:lytic transglycosylase domain-containing protein [Salmonella enterica]EKK6596260.1 lytic transglycosylase domain-containing protein [Salmonella enterica]
MSIKIPVSAQFDTDDIKGQLKAINDMVRILGNQVAMANKQKFEPVTLKSKEDMEGFIKQMEQLLSKQTEFAQKMKQIGQGGHNPLFANFKKMSSNRAEQLKMMQMVLQWGGGEFHDIPPGPAPATPPPPRPPRTPGTPTPTPPPPAGRPGGAQLGPWGQMGLNVAQAGFRAAGPVGGTLSSALGAGMSGGAAAGLMGLVGGMAALFVGKLVGAIAEKVKDAQVESITIDRIIRQTGGTSRYASVRNNIRATANALGVSYNEMASLGSGYARTSNIGPGGNIAAEMYTGGAVSRAYGLDLSSGMNFMGGLRGANITSGDQANRRVGIVIGETLAKAGVFGKADEMLQVITQFALNQARVALVAPNLEGYGGAMAGLLSSKTPGLDVAGAGAMLGHVNQAIMQGGNAGEAGQFLFQRLANRQGLSPFMSQVMREGGMFATKSQMFGEGSQYAKMFGAGPGGDQTMFDMTMQELKRSYPNPRDQVQAMSKLFGLSLNQSMALSGMGSEAANGVGKRLEKLKINIGDVNMTGIQDMGRIEKGEQGAVANELLNRTGKGALTAKEKEDLKTVMDKGSSEDLKNMTTAIVAEKGQQETEGSKTRDSIAEVGNIFQEYAGKALPLINDIRMAAITLTGKKPGEMKQEFLNSEHEENLESIQKAGDLRKDAALRASKEYDIAHPNYMVQGTPEFKRSSALAKQVEVEQQTTDKAIADENTRFANIGKKPSENQRDQTSLAGVRENIVNNVNRRAIFDQVSKETGIPATRLMAIAGAESNGNSRAVSKAGALGIAQVMPENFLPGEDPFDDLTNVRAAARVYKDAIAWEKKHGGGDAERLRYYNGGRRRGSKENIEYPSRVYEKERMITDAMANKTGPEKANQDAQITDSDVKKAQDPAAQSVHVNVSGEVAVKQPDGSVTPAPLKTDHNPKFSPRKR